MKVRSITLEGETGFTATISLGTSPEATQNNDLFITCEIYDAQGELVTMHLVSPDDRDDQWSMAECLQNQLDGSRGTNSMIHDFFREIQRFAN